MCIVFITAEEGGVVGWSPTLTVYAVIHLCMSVHMLCY